MTMDSDDDIDGSDDEGVGEVRVHRVNHCARRAHHGEHEAPRQPPQHQYQPPYASCSSRVTRQRAAACDEAAGPQPQAQPQQPVPTPAAVLRNSSRFSNSLRSSLQLNSRRQSHSLVHQQPAPVQQPAAPQPQPAPEAPAAEPQQPAADRTACRKTAAQRERSS